MKKKLIFIFLIVGCITIISCEDNLDIEQQGVISTETFYQTDTDAVEAISRVYSQWRGMYFNQFFLKNLLSDDVYAGGGSRGDNPNYEDINEYQFTDNSSVVAGYYADLYTLIYYCNLILDNFDGTESNTIARVVAEAKTVRAWANFDLVTLWGTPQLVTHVLSSNEYQQPNSTASEIWKQVETDLTEAINSGALPSKTSVDDKETGIRLTNEAAESLLGKAYVFMEEYAKAATLLKKVINTGLYELYNGDYGDMLRETAEFSSESVFESNSINDNDNADQGTLMWGLMIGWRADALYLYTSPVYPAGWGFANPSSDLYDAFVEMEGEDGYRLKQTMKTFNDLKNTMGVYITSNYVYGNTGYFMWKHRFVASEVISSSYGFYTSTNFRWIRYAEVLLLASEACLESGENNNALAYINEVRERAQLQALSSLTLDDIKKEKRLELCGECVRYQDLVRWGDAATVLAEQGKNIPVLNSDGTVKKDQWTNSSYGFVSGKHNLLPFPEEELSVNPNLVQNPKW